MAYSARLSRWISGRPGIRMRSGRRSSSVSSHAIERRHTRPDRADGMPSGGIKPVCSFRDDLLPRLGVVGDVLRFSVSRVSPAVFGRVLWQVTQ